MGSPNSKSYLPDLTKGVDFAFIFEPTQPDGRVINTCNGIGKFDVYVTRWATHAGKSPETGISAVLKMAYQIINADHLARKELLTTRNAGFVEGGNLLLLLRHQRMLKSKAVLSFLKNSSVLKLACSSW
jgi:di/tripeptidase